jgi:hypothetical protein
LIAPPDSYVVQSRPVLSFAIVRVSGFEVVIRNGPETVSQDPPPK